MNNSFRTYEDALFIRHAWDNAFVRHVELKHAVLLAPVNSIWSAHPTPSIPGHSESEHTSVVIIVSIRSRSWWAKILSYKKEWHTRKSSPNQKWRIDGVGATLYGTKINRSSAELKKSSEAEIWLENSWYPLGTTQGWGKTDTSRFLYTWIGTCIWCPRGPGLG